MYRKEKREKSKQREKERDKKGKGKKCKQGEKKFGIKGNGENRIKTEGNGRKGKKRRKGLSSGTKIYLELKFIRKDKVLKKRIVSIYVPRYFYYEVYQR